MTDAKHKEDEAIEMMRSLRGQWIIGQALTVAAGVIDGPALPFAERQPSNAKDMLFLRDHLFPLWAQVQEATSDAHVAFERKQAQDAAGDAQDAADQRRETEEGR